ncbi:MAG: hypothetical protein RMJ66_01085 [Bacteroidia bacterium]|nr:hypothetical protein [Bacteroidia bacterium]MDW8133637.1 hypothetical protein [Bacteroidia bacterium]
MAILRPAWVFSGRKGWQGKVQLGGILQGQTIPQSGAMNYIRYPGSSEIVYEQELYEESKIYAQVFTGGARALQTYIHPYLEKRWTISQNWIQWRIGAWHSYEIQRFRARQLGFFTDTAGGGPYVLPSETYNFHNIGSVYDPQNIREGGFYLVERTGDYHRHSGKTGLQQVILGGGRV